MRKSITGRMLQGGHWGHPWCVAVGDGVRHLCLLGLVIGFCLSGVARADSGFEQVRFARGDVDGDGQMDIVAGGRLGSALPVDAPRSVRRAGLGVYRRAGHVLQPIFERRDVQVVSDVAAGDMDGDGRDEVVSVGMGQLTVWAWRDNALATLTSVMLGGIRTDRVAVGDVDGDGRGEVAVAIYDIGPDAEIGQTEVVFYRLDGTHLVRFMSQSVALHVGDLCVADLSGVGCVIVEVGAGEEGGVIRALRVNGDGALFEVGAPTHGVRALSLDVFDERLVVGRLDGVIRVYEMGSYGLTLRESIQRQPGLSTVMILPDRTVFLGGTGLNVRTLPMGF